MGVSDGQFQIKKSYKERLQFSLEVIDGGDEKRRVNCTAYRSTPNSSNVTKVGVTRYGNSLCHGPISSLKN